MSADERLRYLLRTLRADGLTRSPGGIEMTLDGGERLRVDVLRADVLRLKISRQGVFDEQPSCAVEGDAAEALGGSREFTVEETADILELSASTVNREIKFAKAWISNEIQSDPEPRS